MKIHHLMADFHGSEYASAMDQLQLHRLKKRKLALKDIIARLESRLIPDQPA